MVACTFIGHSACSENLKPVIYNEIEKLILTEKVDTFYVGTQGNFDFFVYQVLCELEKIYNIKIIVVLAYLNNKKDSLYYDPNKTIFPETLENTPAKFAISKRNLYMIEKSRYIIFNIDHTFSNAYKFVNKALSKDLKVINIGKYKII